LTLTIGLPKQLEQFKLLHEVTRADIQDRSVERKNFEASILGKCSDGGEMEADWLSLENTHVDINRTDAKAILDPRTGRFVFDVFEAIKSATILEGHASLELIVASEVKIKYSKISPSAFVSVFTGITNFIFRGGNIDKLALRHNYINDELII